MKKRLFFLMTLFVFSGINMQAKTKNKAKNKAKVEKPIKDKTCQNIKDMFNELKEMLKETTNKDIESFLENNTNFFDAHNKKIKRHCQTMDTFFWSGEKRRAQREIKLIQAFYVCNMITNPEDEDQIADFVKANYDKSVWYVNSIAHVQRLHFNFTGFADEVRAMIKFIKKDKIMNDVIISKELKYSLINKLEAILYTVTQQGEHKIEKRKQRLHLAAEFAKGLLRAF